jgi:hypothetical protein
VAVPHGVDADVGLHRRGPKLRAAGPNSATALVALMDLMDQFLALEQFLKYFLYQCLPGGRKLIHQSHRIHQH